ncbi:unnamed protein product [Hymenolepis diminuta]|uniref:Uncharacterized protein n=1 Tax=Hymenolepis diminuta TaxID=6216 RepID=A0A564ZC05_HYMDI|nr:unnamed protein product [Hymenolepis diminuta]
MDTTEKPKCGTNCTRAAWDFWYTPAPSSLPLFTFRHLYTVYLFSAQAIYNTIHHTFDHSFTFPDYLALSKSLLICTTLYTAHSHTFSLSSVSSVWPFFSTLFQGNIE